MLLQSAKIYKLRRPIITKRDFERKRMHYVITLTNAADRSYAESLGYRASDLGFLKDKGFNIPLSFIANNEAFEEFIGENSLKAKISRLAEEKPGQDYFPEIIALFQAAAVPNDLKEEINEAYESLTIEPGAPASSMVSSHDHPFVTLIISPNYLTPTENNEGVLQNIKGKEMLIEALKLVWATAYSPASISFRKKSGIKDFKLGVIVQKMKKTQSSAIAYSRSDFDDKSIIVKSYSGLQDYDDEILGKDIHEVQVNSLLITKVEINNQECRIERDIESDELVKRPLLSSGSRQKVNDKIISEIARLAKKSKSLLGKDLKVFFGIQDEYINILQVNRLVFSPKTRTVEIDEVDMKTDDAGNKVVEHRHEFTAMQQEKKDEKFTLPGIISHDEAKENILKDAPHKIFTLDGFELKKKPEESSIPPAAAAAPDSAAALIPKIEIIEDGNEGKNNIEDEILLGENLLEQVLKIKEVTERMEEHALNNNREEYTRQAKLLRELVFRARRQ
jgi:phosphoenolpyruvate synthase/pyruvate phosphate dikinase